MSEIIKYPENISKQEFLDNYTKEMLSLVKEGMRSSYEFISSPSDDDMWCMYLDKNLTNGVRYIICKSESLFKGYLVWNIEDDNIEIYDLIIHPDYQCDGATLRRLLVSFADDIKDIVFDNIIAYTNNKNERMARLLYKSGFRVLEIRERGKRYYLNGKDFINIYSRPK